MTACWCVVLFFASAGASSAYLTVSEVFPMETRALAIAFFYAIGTAAGGISGPLLFSSLVSTGKVSDTVIAFVTGASLMILAGLARGVPRGQGRAQGPGGDRQPAHRRGRRPQRGRCRRLTAPRPRDPPGPGSARPGFRLARCREPCPGCGIGLARDPPGPGSARPGFRLARQPPRPPGRRTLPSPHQSHTPRSSPGPSVIMGMLGLEAQRSHDHEWDERAVGAGRGGGAGVTLRGLGGMPWMGGRVQEL